MSVAELRSVSEHAAPWPMVAAYGEIHRYVGDELIATWKLPNGIADAHCVRACFDVPKRLTALSPVSFGITKRPLGDLHLRGKESDVVLYALERARR